MSRRRGLAKTVDLHTLSDARETPKHDLRGKNIRSGNHTQTSDFEASCQFGLNAVTARKLPTMSLDMGRKADPLQLRQRRCSTAHPIHVPEKRHFEAKADRQAENITGTNSVVDPNQKSTQNALVVSGRYGQLDVLFFIYERFGRQLRETSECLNWTVPAHLQNQWKSQAGYGTVMRGSRIKWCRLYASLGKAQNCLQVLSLHQRECQ